MEAKNVVGSRVVEARRNAKPRVTQTDLIARLQTLGVNLEQSALSKIEHGQRPVNDKEIIALAQALRVSVVWLLQTER
nr:helix-turn-helix transcriptional regulator [Dehalogenimonas formicexedens]